MINVVTPDVLRMDAAKVDALMEAFEHTFLNLADLGEGEQHDKDRAAMAFYGLRDLLQKVIADMDELCGHMEVCDAVLAIHHARNREGRK